MCVADSSTDRSTIAGTLLWAARWHGAAVGAHLTTPVIILAFNQEGILHSYPCSAWGSRAWQIELTAKVVSRDRAEAVWTDRAGYTLPHTQLHPESEQFFQTGWHIWISSPDCQKTEKNRPTESHLKVNIQITSQKQSSVPVLVKVGHHRHGVEHVPAHGPAGSVDAVLWYFDRWETLTGQSLQRGKHGAPYK